MRKLILILATLSFSGIAGAETVLEKKAKDEVNTNFATAMGEVKDCGKKFKGSYDWKSYDAIDWKKADRVKNEYYSAEALNVKDIGKAFNEVCKDKDYKAALGKVSEVIYRPIFNYDIRVTGKLEGSKLIITNNAIGGTRYSDDFVTAIKEAL